MARTNVNRNKETTHEGAPAKNIKPLDALKRSVLSCLLWENEFYEDGETVAKRIKQLCSEVMLTELSILAIQARTDYKLRHVPLLLVRELARMKNTGSLVSNTLKQVIQRADELTEFVSIYWKDGRQPLSAQVKKGLAAAFRKFSPYQLAKYNRGGPVKLRDVLFLSHPKPADDQQQKTWKALVDGTLPAPDTWEVSLSGGADKKGTFVRLLAEGKLGYMALLRNLRNMRDAGVDKAAVAEQLISRAAKSWALPFRFISAARAVPQWEDIVDTAMQESLNAQPRLKGKTLVLVDHSYSMVGTKVSARSDIDRLDAASALAALVAGIAEDFEIWCFSCGLTAAPSRQGMGLIDFIRKLTNGNTYLGKAVKAMNKIQSDRLIVFTDEQSHDPVPDPIGRGYMINVASSKNGVGYHKWTHIDGFSESVIKWIMEYESMVEEKFE